MGPHTQLALHHKTRFFKKLILITCPDGGPNLQIVIAMCNTKKKIAYGEHFPLMANHKIVHHLCSCSLAFRTDLMFMEQNLE
jgi:hypothetical protein